MLSRYKNIGNVALGLAAVCAVAIGMLGRNSTNGNVWGPGGAPPLLMYATALSVVIMFWAYVKAKGYSGWLGVLLPLLSVIGLAVLVGLKDRHAGTTKIPGGVAPSAGKVWVTYAFGAVGLCALAYVVYAIKVGGV